MTIVELDRYRERLISYLDKYDNMNRARPEQYPYVDTIDITINNDEAPPKAQYMNIGNKRDNSWTVDGKALKDHLQDYYAKEELAFVLWERHVESPETPMQLEGDPSGSDVMDYEDAQN